MRPAKKPESEVAVPVTVRLPRSAIERLESAAAGQGLTRSEFVRALLLEARLPKPSGPLPSPGDRTVILKVLSAVNSAGRRIERAVALLELVTEGKVVDDKAIDRAANALAAVDAALREALAHACKV